MLSLILMAVAALHVASATFVNDDNLKYTCPSGTMLMVYNKEVDRVRMVCRPPSYCGVQTSCQLQTGALCTQEKQFLTQVITIPNKNSFLATCCVFEPPPNRKYKERCLTYKVVPKEMAGSDPNHPRSTGSVPDGMEVMSLLIEDGFGKGPESGFPSVKGLVPTTFGWSVIFCFPSCDEETTTPPTQQPSQAPQSNTVVIGSCSSAADCASKCSAGGPAPTKRKRDANTGVQSSSCSNGQCSCQYNPQQGVDTSAFHPGAGAASCFSADQTVQTPSGPMRMDMLQTGQQVLVHNEAGVVYETVDSFLHRRDDIVTSFINIRTANGAQLTLSPEHNLPVLKCGTGGSNSQLRYARDAQLGECLLVRDASGNVQETPIMAMSEVEKTGIYAPLTRSGTVLVNDVVASCYAKYEGYFVQNAFYRVFVQLQKVFAMAPTVSSLMPVDPPSMLHLFETVESV